jgi:DNA-binding transcriptional LysR family regulator
MRRAAPDWSLYRSFLAVLRDRSLSGAARSLNLTQPTLARHIDALEEQLGFELFTRSQLGLAPTEAALALVPYAENIEANTAALLRAASGIGQAVKGTVRITASEIVGAEVLPPMLGNLRLAYPGLEFELVLSDAVDNLLRRDADIAVRMVEPIQEALVVKKLGTVTVGLHAHRN